MAEFGSKGVGWKVSSFAKSDVGGAGVGCGVDFRPVRESQIVIVETVPSSLDEAVEGYAQQSVARQSFFKAQNAQSK